MTFRVHHIWPVACIKYEKCEEEEEEEETGGENEKMKRERK